MLLLLRPRWLDGTLRMWPGRPGARLAVRHVLLTGRRFLSYLPSPYAVQRAVENSAHMHPRREELRAVRGRHIWQPQHQEGEQATTAAEAATATTATAKHHHRRLHHHHHDDHSSSSNNSNNDDDNNSSNNNNSSLCA